MTNSADASRCGFDGSGFLRADVHASGVEPCPVAGDRGDPVPGPAHRDGGVADPGLGGRGDILQIPPGVEPGGLVGVAGGENTVRAAGRVGRPPGLCADRLGGRNRGAAEGHEDQGQGVLPGRGALDAKQSGEVLRAEMDLPDGAGAAALEPAPVGAAVPDPAGPVGAGGRVGGPPAQDHRGLDHPGGQAGVALAGGGHVHTGRRRGLCLRRAGACVPGEPIDAGVPPAPGCPPV